MGRPLPDRLCPLLAQDCACRDVHLECGSPSRLAVHLDEAPVALHDGADRREADACPLPGLLGGEKRLKNPGYHIRRNSCPGVGNRDGNVGAHLRFKVGTDVMSVEGHVLSRDMDLSPFRHCVPGIDAEVHQDLMELRGIAGYRPEIRRKVRRNPDCPRERLGENLDDILGEMGGLQHDVLPLHPAGEHQHLPDEVGTSRCTAFQGVQHALRLRVLALVSEVVDGKKDRAEDVIQVVRDPPCQCPDALHALGPEELCFEFLLLCDVRVDGQDRGRAPVALGSDCPAAFGDDHAAFLGQLRKLPLPLSLPVKRLKRRPVLLRIAGEELQGLLPLCLSRPPAVHFLRPLIPVKDPVVQATDEDRVGRYVEQGSLAPDGLLGGASLGDVLLDRDVMVDRPAGVAHGRNGLMLPECLPVLLQVLQGAPPDPACGDRPPEFMVYIGWLRS